MGTPSNRHILEALALVRKMIALADEGEQESADDSCVLLYGVIRDCAYSIRRQAERERDAHVSQGIWDFPSAPDPVAAIAPPESAGRARV